LHRQVMPVISPITYDGAGQLLNTNADSVAGAVAVALSRIDDTELIFCFDKPGVLLDVNDADSVIPVLDKEKYAGYLEQGAIHAGMIPKLDNAFKTIKAGVKSVRLTDPCHLDGGTVLR
jgi:acetylglutamate kinase